MSVNCQQATEQVGNGVAAALRGVDCIAGEASAAAFGRLFAPGGSLGTVLTILLTIFIALFALALLTGRTNIGVRSLVPRMMTLGLVLTFATSWIAYQSVVWNLAVATPDYLAGILTGTQGSATDTFAQKIDVVFIAIQEASAGAEDISTFSPEGMMWFGALLFMLGTVGLLVTTKIALGVLIALGPLFVVMALFNGTRGLFTGWVKGLTMCALAPLFAVLGGSVMLELAVPILAALTAVPGQVDPQAGMAFFMIGAVHVALMVLVLKVAGTMVAGWSVFGLVPDREEKPSPAAAPQQAAPAPALAQAQSANQTSSQARKIDVSAVPTSYAANDPGGSDAGGSRVTKVYATSSGSAQQAISSKARVRGSGIGSRFKSAAPKALDRSMEKHA
ncbi:type IV secretion system protein [Erythrobacter sp.]|uniref:type IV secretion system protein n=1 Tax=Erythrobacter sp. TaxID=1042 RepID=UPI001B185529|nr:type IV secretion system protein [Erythrobacter sp.]MBO6527353.1 type IV secretion system protein [Erythrobacter sp.]MBO6530737.1 type IV secretion system protein [Erythrobacter sp.]